MSLNKGQTVALELIVEKAEVVSSWLSGARKAKVDEIVSDLRSLAAGDTPDVTPVAPSAPVEDVTT